MLSLARTTLYSIVIFFSFFAFVLSAAFIGRTNSDFSVYNEGSAAILAASLLILLTLPVLHFLFHRRATTSILASVLVELVVLSVLWVILLGGAAATSDQLPGLSFCNGSLCSLGRGVQAFAWLAWITLTLLLALVVTLAIVSTTKTDEGIWTRQLDTSQKLGRGNKEAHSTSQPTTQTSTSAPVTQSNVPVMSSV